MSDGRPESPQEGGPTEQTLGGRPPYGPDHSLFCDQHFAVWGKLPPRLQGTLKNASSENLPLHYRRWLEAYHRRAARQGR